eukprot:PhM_4_TR17622/c0_g1_i1/m.30095
MALPSAHELADQLNELEEEYYNLRATHSQCGHLREKNEELSLRLLGLQSELQRMTNEREKWKAQYAASAAGGRRHNQKNNSDVLGDGDNDGNVVADVNSGGGSPLPPPMALNGLGGAGAVSRLDLENLRTFSRLVMELMGNANATPASGQGESWRGVLMDGLRFVSQWLTILEHGGDDKVTAVMEMHNVLVKKLEGIALVESKGMSALLDDARASMKDKSRVLAEIERMKEHVQRMQEAHSLETFVDDLLAYHDRETSSLMSIIESDTTLIEALKIAEGVHVHDVALQQQEHWRGLYQAQREQLAKLQASVAASAVRMRAGGHGSPPRGAPSGGAAHKFYVDPTKLHFQSRNTFLNDVADLRKKFATLSQSSGTLPTELVEYHQQEVDVLLSQLKYDEELITALTTSPLSQDGAERSGVEERAKMWSDKVVGMRQHIGELEKAMVSMSQHTLEHVAKLKEVRQTVSQKVEEFLAVQRQYQQQQEQHPHQSQGPTTTMAALGHYEVQLQTMLEFVVSYELLLEFFCEGNLNVEKELEQHRFWKSLYMQQREASGLKTVFGQAGAPGGAATTRNAAPLPKVVEDLHRFETMLKEASEQLLTSRNAFVADLQRVRDLEDVARQRGFDDDDFLHALIPKYHRAVEDVLIRHITSDVELFTSALVGGTAKKSPATSDADDGGAYWKGLYEAQRDHVEALEEDVRRKSRALKSGPPPETVEKVKGLEERLATLTEQLKTLAREFMDLRDTSAKEIQTMHWKTMEKALPANSFLSLEVDTLMALLKSDGVVFGLFADATGAEIQRYLSERTHFKDLYYKQREHVELLARRVKDAADTATGSEQNGELSTLLEACQRDLEFERQRAEAATDEVAGAVSLLVSARDDLQKDMGSLEQYVKRNGHGGGDAGAHADDFHAAETRILLSQLHLDTKLIAQAFKTGGQNDTTTTSAVQSLNRELKQHQYWRDLYLQQREQLGAMHIQVATLRRNNGVGQNSDQNMKSDHVSAFVSMDVLKELTRLLVDARTTLFLEVEALKLRCQPTADKSSATLQTYDFHETESTLLLQQLGVDSDIINQLLSAAGDASVLPKVREAVTSLLSDQDHWRHLYQRQRDHVAQLEAEVARLQDGDGVEVRSPNPEGQSGEPHPPSASSSQSTPPPAAGSMPEIDLSRAVECALKLQQEAREELSSVRERIGDPSSDFRRLETNSLLDQLSSSDEFIKGLFAGHRSARHVAREIEQQHYWRDLYTKQRDYVSSLEDDIHKSKRMLARRNFNELADPVSSTEQLLHQMRGKLEDGERENEDHRPVRKLLDYMTRLLSNVFDALRRITDGTTSPAEIKDTFVAGDLSREDTAALLRVFDDVLFAGDDAATTHQANDDAVRTHSVAVVERLEQELAQFRDEFVRIREAGDENSVVASFIERFHKEETAVLFRALRQATVSESSSLARTLQDLYDKQRDHVHMLEAQHAEQAGPTKNRAEHLAVDCAVGTADGEVVGTSAFISHNVVFMSELQRLREDLLEGGAGVTPRDIIQFHDDEIVMFLGIVRSYEDRLVASNNSTKNGVEIGEEEQTALWTSALERQSHRLRELEKANVELTDKLNETRAATPDDHPNKSKGAQSSTVAVAQVQEVYQYTQDTLRRLTTLRDGLTSSAPTSDNVQAIFEYHEHETALLMRMLHKESEWIRALSTVKEVHTDTEAQRNAKHWKELFAAQREHARSLERQVVGQNKQQRRRSSMTPNVEYLRPPSSMAGTISNTASTPPAGNLAGTTIGHLEQALQELRRSRQSTKEQVQALRDRVLIKNATLTEGLEEVLQFHEAEVRCLSEQIESDHSVLMSALRGQSVDEEGIANEISRQHHWRNLYTQQRDHVAALERALEKKDVSSTPDFGRHPHHQDESTKKMKAELKKLRHDQDTLTQLLRKSREDFVNDLAALRSRVSLNDVRAAARNNAVGDSSAAIKQLCAFVVEYHAEEVDALLKHLRLDMEIIAKLITASSDEGSDTLTLKLMLEEGDGDWRSMYMAQRTQIQSLESQLTASGGGGGRKSSASTLTDGPPSGAGVTAEGFLNDAAMVALQDFCSTTQRDLEREKSQWRTRCLSAEEQLRTMEAHVKTLEVQLNVLRRATGSGSGKR